MKIVNLYRITEILFAVLFALLFYSADAHAEEALLTPHETTDLEKIVLDNAEKLPKIDEIWDL